ncbi:MAG: TerC/Alx family metal homeostasis membrane protein [Bacteroidales bacterium]|nr:TerC/Alx family metal homeostasis membrane protein [Bacteroidales bacterium]
MVLNEISFFSVFLILIVFILLLDLGVFNRKSHALSLKESIIWSIIWISLALFFYAFLRFKGDWIHGINSTEDIRNITEKYLHPINLSGNNFSENLEIYRNNLSLEFITGYLIEYALSVDNIFVMVLIFYTFGVNRRYYKRVLFYGITGAIVMRFIFIFISSALIQEFSWILYLFGLLLIFTGVKMFISRNKKEKIESQKHPVVRFASKYFSVFPRFVGQHFIIRKNKKLMLTPLLITLLVIEFSDVIFAVDSVPAIFSVTKDPYIVFFSNIFAIIGLRSLFFLIINIIGRFYYLKHGLSILLTFVGLKMLFSHWLKEIGFTTAHSLYVILFIIIISIVLSILFPKKEKIAEH